MLASLALASAAVVAIFNIIAAMEDDISRQLTDIGANVIITADSGELTFQYGGITIPELVFDAEIITIDDISAIDSIPDSHVLIALAPKLIGSYSLSDNRIVVAGVDLPGEFAVKPWLRFHDAHEQSESDESGAEPENQGEMKDMDYQALILDRMNDVPRLEDNEAVIGAALASDLGVGKDDNLLLGEKNYTIIAVLEEAGFLEDYQLFISVSEAQELLGRQGELTVIELTADFSLVDESVLIAQLQEAIPHASVTGVLQAVMGRNELLNTINRFGIFTGSLIAAAGIIAASLTMLSAVKGRTREIGIFRALGFRSKHIFSIIIAEALFVGAAGGLLGYHLGMAAARYASPLLTGADLSSAWDPATLAIAVLVTALSGIIAGSIPALKAMNLDPAEALRFN